MTLSHGIAPSIATLECAPQPNFPAGVGTLTFWFDSAKVDFPDCKINYVSAHQDATGGTAWTFQILDRRWKWEFGSISGSYNLRTQDDKDIIADSERSPQHLAELLFEAMNEQKYDVSELPNNSRPFVDWNEDNPAHLLEELCSSLGCRVVLRLDNTVKICRVGEGAQLPNLPGFEMDNSGTIDPPEAPDFLKISFGVTKVQGLMHAEAVGIDTDGDVKPIDDLSYKPSGGWGAEIVGTYSGVTDTDTPQAGGKETNPRKLAKATVFKMYRIDRVHDANWQAHIGGQLTGFNYSFQRIDQHLPLFADLVDIDSETGKAAKPFVQGVFKDRNLSHTNTAAWTKYTQGFSVDQERGIITFSDYVYKWTTSGSRTSPVEGADIYLSCCFPVKDHVTRAAHRFGALVPLGPKNKTEPKVVKHEEVSLALRAQYDSSGNIAKFLHNRDQIDAEATLLLDATAASYQTKTPGDKTYAGLVKIELDGAIQQITFNVAEGQGFTTRASRNNEHSLALPSYKDRQFEARMHDTRSQAAMRAIQPPSASSPNIQGMR